ncbi:DUF3108 domain-containing protein [Undibacterium cyanobacteriorum]|uniref:DUF3108 domain-containing protein n=1 Tax=Undibacterium cyanobacteriorum TaxID=3073561 RepID=A0ABY9RHS0_9BURK|nr:DUF3108 domain-containing protein [Undibacterium sp. 20NA77.5]WMW80383.1 DUF3108 domain-containing protein [Undibacterium sp. 20NA77.5]
MLLHYLFLESVPRKNWTIDKPNQVPLAINLKVEAPEPTLALAPPTTKAKKKSKPRTTTSTSQLNSSQKDAQTPEFSKEETPAISVAEDAAPSPEAIVESPNTETPFSLRLPPPAEMKMEVSYTKANSTPTNGFGSLTWNTDGTSYSASLEVGIDLLLTTINLIQLNSEGVITSEGLAPTQSTDTRRNRSTTAIHFKHADKQIIFSSSNKIVAMEAGAQDALSVLMQLAAIGNSDAKRLAAGSSIAIQVAEGRDAQQFFFEVLGEEQIDSKLGEDGRLHTVHLIRPPRPGSYNSTLEIWLAPEKSWYPVRIKNTESNGTVTLQTITEIVQRRILLK